MVISQPLAHRQKEAQQADTMRAHVAKIKAWLKDNDDKPGKSGGATDVCGIQIEHRHAR